MIRPTIYAYILSAFAAFSSFASPDIDSLLNSLANRGMTCRMYSAEELNWALGNTEESPLFELNQKAQTGDADAMYSLTVALWNTPKDHLTQIRREVAFSWLKQSYEKGNMNAANHLGICYKTGDGCEKNHKEAFRVLNEAYIQYHRAIDKISLGHCYREAVGCKQNMHFAFELYKEAADIDQHIEGKYYTAMMLMWGFGCETDKAEAVRRLREIALKGHKFAQRRLFGELLSGAPGMSLAESHSEAFYWARLLSGQSSKFRATFNVLKLHGLGTKSQTLSMIDGLSELYEMALAKNTMALYHVAAFFMADSRIPRTPHNNKSAFRMFESAAKLGDAQASYAYASCLQFSIGCEQDKVKADDILSYYHKARTAGITGAHEALAYCLLFGVHGKLPSSSDLVLAHQILSEKKDTYLSAVMLGGMYALGVGVEQDPSKAQEVLLDYSDQQDVPSFILYTMLLQHQYKHANQVYGILAHTTQNLTEDQLYLQYMNLKAQLENAKNDNTSIAKDATDLTLLCRNSLRQMRTLLKFYQHQDDHTQHPMLKIYQNQFARKPLPPKAQDLEAYIQDIHSTLLSFAEGYKNAQTNKARRREITTAMNKLDSSLVKYMIKAFENEFDFMQESLAEKIKEAFLKSLEYTHKP